MPRGSGRLGVNLPPQQDFKFTEEAHIQGIQKQIQVMQRPRYLKLLCCLDIGSLNKK